MLYVLGNATGCFHSHDDQSHFKGTGISTGYRDFWNDTQP